MLFLLEFYAQLLHIMLHICMYVCMMHRGLLEPYSYYAHLATCGGQTSVVDKNAFAHLI